MSQPLRINNEVITRFYIEDDAPNVLIIETYPTGNYRFIGIGDVVSGVISVNGEVGVVTLDTSDLIAVGDSLYVTAVEKLALHTQNTDTGTNNNDFTVGDALNSDKRLFANTGAGNLPFLLYNVTTSRWEKSDDGVIITPIGGSTNLAITRTGTSVTVTNDTGTDAVISQADATDAGVLSNVDKIKLDTVESNAAADQIASEVPVTPAGNLISTDVQAALQELQTDIDNLDQAIVLRGTWNPNTGVFPGGGTAQAGDQYIVVVGGTVDGATFQADDKITAIIDNASTATFLGNWHRSVDTITTQNAAQVPFTPAGNILATDVQAALEEVDTEKEPSFIKNSGFNLNLGTIGGTVAEGDDSRFHNRNEDIVLNSGVNSIVDLRTIITTTLSINATILYRGGTGNVLNAFELDSGTDADNGTTIIRPNDYAASTNEKVWRIAHIIDPKLISQDLTWSAAITHNVINGLDSAVFAGTPSNSTYNITNTDIVNIDKGLISFDSPSGEEITFQMDGNAANARVAGSANSVATLGTGDYTIFAFSIKKINLSTTIIILTQTDF